MTRIQPVTNPEGQAAELYEAVTSQLGMVPNIFKTFGNSPAVLDFYMQGSGALGNTSISAQLRESIALTVAGANSCDYCASAHTAIGAGAGLGADELASNLHTKSEDAKAQAALDCSLKLVNSQGNATDADVQALKDAGYTEGEVLEITAVVAFNIFTNYFNHVADTDVDFPLVSTADVSKAA